MANGDVRMNYAQAETMPDLGIWFPAKKRDAKPTTFALPYTAGLAPPRREGRRCAGGGGGHTGCVTCAWTYG